MTTTSAATPISFRTFSFPDVEEGGAVALGRNHASWFLVRARPEGLYMRRVINCLNFALPDDPSAFDARSAGGRRVFAVGGTNGNDIMDDLTSLLDQKGRAPVKVVEVYPEDHPFGLCALVEVLVPDEQLMYACARCGKWETQLGPRFLRCSRCRSRHYCSTKCQKEDWKPAYHKDECALLSEGKVYEVECRRKLHDNGWWFENGGLGKSSHRVQTFLAGTGEYDWERAHITGDWHYLAYGRYTPPHDVPPDTDSRPTFSRESIASMPPDAPFPGFISTGKPAEDRLLIKRFRATILRTDPALPSSMDAFHTPGITRNTVPKHEVPVFPSVAVPQTPGFVFTGDWLLDQGRLKDFLDEHGTEAERAALEDVWEKRLACIDARDKVYQEVQSRSKVYKMMMMAHLGAIEQNARAIERAAGRAKGGEVRGDHDGEWPEGKEGDDDLIEALARMCIEGVCDEYGSDGGSDLREDSKDEEDDAQPAWRSRISVP